MTQPYDLAGRTAWITGAGSGIGRAIALAFAGAGCWVAYARARRRSAREQADAVLAEAGREAQTLRKQAELAAREETLRHRAELDREAEEARRALREQERRLDKRADLLDGKLEMIDRKEREFAAEAQGYTATKHQREVGTGWFDLVETALNPASGTLALAGSTESEQFH